MSRTDKDMPLWTRTAKVIPHHSFKCIYGLMECNLPAVYDKKHNRNMQREYPTRCVYVPIETTYGWRYVFNRKSPPNWYVKHRYHDKHQTEVRDKLRKAIKEYNGSGDADVDIINVQGRNAAKYDYY